jgi:hypothetical protein
MEMGHQPCLTDFVKIAVVFDRDPAAAREWEVLTCYPACTRSCGTTTWPTRSGAPACAGCPVAGALGPLDDRDRDPSGGHDRTARLHRSAWAW